MSDSLTKEQQEFTDMSMAELAGLIDDPDADRWELKRTNRGRYDIVAFRLAGGGYEVDLWDNESGRWLESSDGSRLLAQTLAECIDLHSGMVATSPKTESPCQA